MTKKIYSIRDSKSEIFNLPFFQNTHGEAERSFRETANDPKTLLNKYPEDYDLYYLGEYDESTGKLDVKESAEHIIKAIHCVKKASSTELMDAVESEK